MFKKIYGKNMCYSLVDCYLITNKKGDKKIVFNLNNPNSYDFSESIKIKCGKCIMCRLNHAKTWAMRCMHEASLYKTNYFITLTYAPEHLPTNLSLNISDVQKFCKRVRDTRKFRYFACGEYGEKSNRAHYHMIAFGLKLDDLQIYRQFNDYIYYTSDYLSNKWGKGHVIIGEVNEQSAGYVARYSTKKKIKDKNNDLFLSDDYGELFQVRNEYIHMSKGIGIGWLEKYYMDIVNRGYCFYSDNRKIGIPKLYREWIKKNKPEEYKILLDKINYFIDNIKGEDIQDKYFHYYNNNEIFERRLKKLMRNKI